VTPAVNRIRVAGIPVNDLREEDFESVALSLAVDAEFHQIIFLSLWDLMRARRDKDFRLCVERASLVVPVSRGILMGARFLRKTVPARYMPFDFVIRFLGALETRGRSAYLLGTDRKNLQNAEQNLRQTFPGVKIVGRYTGRYPKPMERNILTAIKKSSPDFVLVGSGVRGKDKWIYRNRKEFPRGVFL
jgi:N-acetylglucosaminyldiphosphoundecaprenol N-acetyl-beta-D-mannosaminyltransferase